MKTKQATPAGSVTLTATGGRTLTPSDIEFMKAWDSASPRLQSIIKALLILLRGKTLQGEPINSEQREALLSLVLPELETLRADGFPCEDVEIVLSAIEKRGKRP